MVGMLAVQWAVKTADWDFHSVVQSVSQKADMLVNMMVALKACAWAQQKGRHWAVTTVETLAYYLDKMTVGQTEKP